MNIGLCRVSSISQKDNTSLSNQKKMIKDYCKMYGIKLSNVISECFSGTTSDRSGLNELKKLVDVSEVIDQNQDTEVSFFTYFTEGMDLTQALLFFAGLVILMALLKGIFTFFTRQTIIIMSRLIEYDLKNEVYQHYQDLSMSFYKGSPSVLCLRSHKEI